MSEYKRKECIWCETIQYTDRDNCMACGRRIEGEAKQHMVGAAVPLPIAPDLSEADTIASIIRHKYVEHTSIDF